MVEILGSGWYHMSDSSKTKMFLFGSENLTLNQNNAIFSMYKRISKDRNVLQFVTIDPTASQAVYSIILYTTL
jgi:hypothetical protein